LAWRAPPWLCCTDGSNKNFSTIRASGVALQPARRRANAPRITTDPLPEASNALECGRAATRQDANLDLLRATAVLMVVVFQVLLSLGLSAVRLGWLMGLGRWAVLRQAALK